MRRLIAMLAATAILGGPLAMGGTAQARDHRDGGERRAERGGGREAGPPARGEARGEDRGGRERGGSRRGDEARRDYGDPRGYDGPPPQSYAPQYAPQYAPSARRGGYLPPEAGGPVADYGRFRLRQPPRGYAWVRTANGYAMVSVATGQVFDVVPF